MPLNDQKNISEIILSVKLLCSKQEKCKSEIIEKLSRTNLSISKIEEIISMLENEKFIDEERYVNFYIRDKLKFNKWGRIKLKYYLKQKRIPDSIITKGLENIDETEYLNILKSEIKKKSKTNSSKDKVIRFAQSKGFELELIIKLLY